MEKTIKTVEFDSFGSPQKGVVSLIEDEHGWIVKVSTHSKEFSVLIATLDQWGCWFSLTDQFTIGHEFGTVPFLGALIETLQALHDILKKGDA